MSGVLMLVFLSGPPSLGMMISGPSTLLRAHYLLLLLRVLSRPQFPVLCLLTFCDGRSSYFRVLAVVLSLQ